MTTKPITIFLALALVAHAQYAFVQPAKKHVNTHIGHPPTHL